MQRIKCVLMHKLMFERDGIPLVWQNGRIVSFDFAEGMLPQFFFPDKKSYKRNAEGFTRYGRMVMNWEIWSRRDMWIYMKGLDNEGQLGELSASAYMELRERFIEQYNKGGFEDLLMEIETAFNPIMADIARDMIGAMQQSLVSF